ncbi:MAG TPA: efflux RND transporter periplasmic adaptor subunit [Bryobacteraceae bacterium]|nr:efflux RND transporter periplasmic adaptor subunit [Bryobacteraceae bacterium]
MPTHLSRIRGPFPDALLSIPAVAVLGLGALFSGCGNLKKVEGQSTYDSRTVRPALFTVPPEQMTHLRIVPVEGRTWQIAVRTTGTVDWDADHTTQAITQVNGPISRILVDYGAKVNAGDPLLYVASPDVANAISAYRKARNRETLTRRIEDRMKDLLAHGAAAAKDVEGAEADYNDAMTDVQNSLQALRIFGITRQEIDQAEQQGATISTELAVRAPIAGTIVQKLVSPGMLIQAGTTVCFMLSDVSTVWVQGHIFDRDLPLVRVGDPVEETNPAAGRTFHGTVAYVGAYVDPATRTTPVRIVTQNPEGLLKKDMFVEAVIGTSTQSNILAVPVAAVLRDDKNEPIVYVQAEPGKFAQRSVTIGMQQDGMVAITSGLQRGENVLADGSVFIQFATSIQ